MTTTKTARTSEMGSADSLVFKPASLKRYQQDVDHSSGRRVISNRCYKEADLGESPIRVSVRVWINTTYVEAFPGLTGEEVERSFLNLQNNLALAFELGAAQRGHDFNRPELLAFVEKGSHGLQVKSRGTRPAHLPEVDFRETIFEISGFLGLVLDLPADLADQFVAEGQNIISTIYLYPPEPNRYVVRLVPDVQADLATFETLKSPRTRLDAEISAAVDVITA